MAVIGLGWFLVGPISYRASCANCCSRLSFGIKKSQRSIRTVAMGANSFPRMGSGFIEKRMVWVFFLEKYSGESSVLK